MYFKGLVLAMCVFLFALTGCSLLSPDQSKQEINQSNASEPEAIAVTDAAAFKSVDIVNAEGKKIGVASLREEKNGVQVQIEVSGLKPGNHGFHIHEKAFKDTDFASAGAHFNPTNKEHGLKNPKGPHIGDMNNLKVKEDGTAIQTEFIDMASLKQGHPNSLLGKSIIIHAGEDDQMSNPAGNSGDRVAGGNIM